jgi:hypothetical protein
LENARTRDRLKQQGMELKVIFFLSISFSFDFFELSLCISMNNYLFHIKKAESEKLKQTEADGKSLHKKTSHTDLTKVTKKR